MSEERFTVTLALVGDPTRPFMVISNEERNRTWDERDKIELSVARSESIASLIERALEAFAVSLPDDGLATHHHIDLAFYTDRDPRGHTQHGVTLIDESGRAIWDAHDMRFVTYGEVVAASDAGALVGDPRRIHIFLREGIGDGAILDWASLIQAYEIAWEIAERIAVVGGVAAAAKIVRDRVARGRKAVESHAMEWQKRGAGPHDFSLFLAIHPWRLDQLSKLLGCSQADTRAVLEVFGYIRGDDELWRPGEDEAARMLADVFREALWHLPYPSKSEQRKFRDRIKVLLETGEAPPRSELAEDFASWNDADPGERLRTGLKAAGIAAFALAIGRLLRRR